MADQFVSCGVYINTIATKYQCDVSMRLVSFTSHEIAGIVSLAPYEYSHSASMHNTFYVEWGTNSRADVCHHANLNYRIAARNGLISYLPVSRRFRWVYNLY